MKRSTIRNLMILVLPVVFLCSMLIFVAQSHALTVNYGYSPGTTQIITPPITSDTTGATMEGMSVTAYFDGDAGSETLTWGDIGSGFSGVIGRDWNLSVKSDMDPWTQGAWGLNSYSGTIIDHILIDAGAGNTVFDTYYSGGIGTPDSQLGKDLSVSSIGTTYEGAIAAIYRDQVALSGFAPVGDLYRYLDIQFEDPFSGILYFETDTDNITGGIQPIPEPATILLLGSGLVGLAGFRRKRV